MLEGGVTREEIAALALLLVLMCLVYTSCIWVLAGGNCCSTAKYHTMPPLEMPLRRRHSRYGVELSSDEDSDEVLSKARVVACNTSVTAS